MSHERIRKLNEIIHINEIIYKFWLEVSHVWEFINSDQVTKVTICINDTETS